MSSLLVICRILGKSLSKCCGRSPPSSPELKCISIILCNPLFEYFLTKVNSVIVTGCYKRHSQSYFGTVGVGEVKI